MSRQQTPDIMANLMNGSADLIDGKHENNKTIKHDSHANSAQDGQHSHSDKPENNKTIKIPNNKAIEQDSVKEIIELKEKATFNLSISTLEALEDAWIKLRRQFKGEQRITKTAIVEMALEICIGELKENNSESSLYKKLANLRSKTKQNDNTIT